MEKTQDYIIATIIGAILGAALGFGNIYIIVLGSVYAIYSYSNFCSELAANKEKQRKQDEIDAEINRIEMKKYRAEERKAKSEIRAWKKECEELYGPF